MQDNKHLNGYIADPDDDIEYDTDAATVDELDGDGIDDGGNRPLLRRPPRTKQDQQAVQRLRCLPAAVGASMRRVRADNAAKPCYSYVQGNRRPKYQHHYGGINQ